MDRTKVQLPDDEDDEPTAVSSVPYAELARGQHGRRGTLVLDPSSLHPRSAPRPSEQTVMLSVDDVSPRGDEVGHASYESTEPFHSPGLVALAAREEVAAASGKWRTVILPGGGRPGAEPDEPEPTSAESTAAISMSSMLRVSLDAPEPADAMSTEALPGMGGPRLEALPIHRLARPPSGPVPRVAIPMEVRGPAGAPGPWSMPPFHPGPMTWAPDPSRPGPDPRFDPRHVSGRPAAPRGASARAGGRGAARRGKGGRLWLGFLLGVVIALLIITGGVVVGLLLTR